MAKYTIELREVVQNYPLFDFSYPFYDEKKRRDFETSFVRHFYFREIGVPTVDQFKHYLEDKFLTVFPYYNELFNTAAIEYSVLDNYNVKETFERSVEGKDKSNAVVSNVGRTEDSQTSKTSENRQEEGSVRNTGTVDTEHSESGQDTDTTNVSGENSSTDTTNYGKETDSEFAGNKHDLKRFLDTPNGKLTLKDGATYLTTLNEDDNDESHSTNTKDSGSDVKTQSGSESSESERVTEYGKETTDKTTNNLLSESDNNTSSNTETQFDGSKTERQDGNTRHESVAERNERYELTRKGNIGVDTDADMIQKHIQLQKILKKIELMFFEECEDLFMLVY